MRIQKICAAAALLLAGLFTSAGASPVTYKLGVVFDGTLDNTPLSSSTLIWTVTADTSAFAPFTPTTVLAGAITSSIDILGFGTLTPTGPTIVAFDPSNSFGDFLVGGISTGIMFGGPTMAGYDGMTSFGPAVEFVEGFVGPIPTDKGDFNISFAPVAIFSAQVVPEPLTLSLFGAGLASAGAMRRRRKAMA